MNWHHCALRSTTSLIWLIGSQLATLAVGLWMCSQIETVLQAGDSPSQTLATAFPAGEQFWRHYGPGMFSFSWIAVLQGFSLWMYESRQRKSQADADVALELRQTKMQADVLRLRDAVVFGLAKLAESRDIDTGHHLDRIAAYSTCLAHRLRQHPDFAHTVNGPFVQDIGVSSALHDIGKVAIEDAILLKPGPLTAEERARMQVHPRVGAQCIAQIGRRLGDANFLELAEQIALYHHERWDGTGYPHGLSGEAIPVSARIVALADVYDALSARRVYKVPFSHERCVEIIREEAGKHFDPRLVAMFLESEAEMLAIRQHYMEADFSSVAAAQESSRRREHAGAIMSADLEQQLLKVVGDEPNTAETAQAFRSA